MDKSQFLLPMRKWIAALENFDLYLVYGMNERHVKSHQVEMQAKCFRRIEHTVMRQEAPILHD